MKNKKNKKILMRIGLGILIAVSLLSILYNNGIKVQIEMDSTFIQGQPVTVNVTVTDNFRPYTPDQLELQIYNQFNKEVAIDKMLTPYAPGKYSVTVTPNFPGTYYVNAILINDNDTIYTKDTFTIEQPVN